MIGPGDVGKRAYWINHGELDSGIVVDVIGGSGIARVEKLHAYTACVDLFRSASEALTDKSESLNRLAQYHAGLDRQLGGIGLQVTRSESDRMASR